MPLLALALVLLAPLLAVALMPLTLVQRYRVGTARRRARGWVVSLNIVLSLLSAGFLMAFAAATSVWVPGALAGTLAGCLGGAALGVLGLALTHWEPGRHDLHFTPNRWLVLAVTLLVSARLAYGVWRAWEAWAQSAGDATWLGVAGVPGSLGAGALVLSYQVSYWVGVRRRLAGHSRARATVTTPTR